MQRENDIRDESFESTLVRKGISDCDRVAILFRNCVTMKRIFSVGFSRGNLFRNDGFKCCKTCKHS